DRRLRRSGALDPQPLPGGLVPRAVPVARLRAVHPRRHRGRGLAGGAPLGRARWRAGPGQRRGAVGGAVRDRRRAALPRPHRLGELLRRGRRPRRGPLRLAGRPRHLGSDRARRRRRLHRCPPRRSGVPSAGRRAGTRDHPGPGDRPAGQLVQPGAVRPPHRPALGAGDPRRDEAPCRLRAVRDLPPDLPLRGPVEPRGPRPAAVGRPPVPHRPRPVVRALRRGVLLRPGVDRGAADRPRAGRRRLRPAPQRLDEHPAVPARRRVLRGVRAPASRPRAARPARGWTGARDSGTRLPRRV
ncbi:MAG: Prolipoprotein diacylglyceryl transferase, partial [uncultured Nocardioides sp.]